MKLKLFFMKKILVYFSGPTGHVIFGGLKFLQEKMDLEISAIIDRANNSKKFSKVFFSKKIFGNISKY